MKATTLLKFQSRNCLNRPNLKIFLGVVVFLIILIIGNISDYNNFQDEKRAFLILEKQKVTNYQNYEQYGAYGFSVLNEPSPLSIYFKSSNYFFLESNIDTKEIIKFNSSYAGSALSQNRNIEPFEFLFYVGSLLMILAGVLSLPEGLRRFLDDHKKESTTLLSKLAFCILLALITLLIAYLLPMIFGIFLSKDEIILYLLYGCYLLIYFAFMFIVGAIISVLNCNRAKRLLWAFSVCIILVFVIPELVNIKKINYNINEANLKKIINTMEFEKAANERLLKKPSTISVTEYQKNLAIEFVNSIYLKNKWIEDIITKHYSDFISSRENTLYFVPGGYFGIVHNELSSKGIYSYKNFRKYVSDLRKAFIDFYILKRFDKKSRAEVENFVKGTENIFRATPIIPKNFYLSVFVNIFYFLIALTVILRLLTRGGGVKREKGPCIDIHTLSQNQSYFFLYSEKKEVQNIISCFEDPLVISDYSKESLIEPGTTVKSWMNYTASLFNLDINVLLQKIKHILKVDGNEESLEHLRLFLLLVKLEEKRNKENRIIILDNYLKGLDSKATQNIQEFLNEQKETLLYVSTDLFVTGRMDRSITRNKIIPIDLMNVYLR